MRVTLKLCRTDRVTFDEKRRLSTLLWTSLLPLRFEMSSMKKMQSIDRELFSGFVESPINPTFLHMSTPSRSECNPMFHLQINGEVLWQLRKPHKKFSMPLTA